MKILLPHLPARAHDYQSRTVNWRHAGREVDRRTSVGLTMTIVCAQGNSYN